MRSRVTVLLVLVTASLVGAGCATKGWVREQVGLERSQTDKQVSDVEGRVGTEAKRVDATTARVGEVEKQVEGVNKSVENTNRSVESVSRSVEGVSKSAQAAQDRADSALARAEQSDQRLTRLWTKRYDRQPVDTQEVLFKFGRADLEDGAQTLLLGVVRELKGNPNLSVDLVGYTDPVGPQEYNMQLSQRRVEAVRRFLVQQGIEMPRINFVGLGVLSETGIPNDKKRRVTVRTMVAAAD